MTEADAYRALRALPFRERVDLWRAARAWALPHSRGAARALSRRFFVWQTMLRAQRADVPPREGQ